LLEASIDGCTEAIMLAYGLQTELLVDLVNAGLATATIERMIVGGRRVKVIRMRITADWPAGAREPSMALILKRAGENPEGPTKRVLTCARTKVANVVAAGVGVEATGGQRLT
jgi:hypothetical protein